MKCELDACFFEDMKNHYCLVVDTIKLKKMLTSDIDMLEEIGRAHV